MAFDRLDAAGEPPRHLDLPDRAVGVGERDQRAVERTVADVGHLGLAVAEGVTQRARLEGLTAQHVVPDVEEVAAHVDDRSAVRESVVHEALGADAGGDRRLRQQRRPCARGDGEQLVEGRVEAPHEADPQLAARRVGGVAHRVRVGQLQRDRLLAQHVGAALEGGDGVMGVQEGRRAHADRLRREREGVGGVGERLGPRLGGGQLGPRPVGVDDRDDPGPGRRPVPGVARAHVARADDDHPQGLVAVHDPYPRYQSGEAPATLGAPPYRRCRCHGRARATIPASCAR
jgi:hypothetical protein